MWFVNRVLTRLCFGGLGVAGCGVYIAVTEGVNGINLAMIGGGIVVSLIAGLILFNKGDS